VDALLPSPDDTLARVLLWLAAPVPLVLALLTLSAAWSWVTTARTTARTTSRLVRGVAELVTEGTTQTGRTVVWLALSQALLVSTTYAIPQLLQLMNAKDANGEHVIAGGAGYSTGHTFSEAIAFDHWNPITQWCVLIALAAVVLQDLAIAARAPTLMTPTLVLLPVVVVFVGAAVLGALVGLIVVFLGLTGDEEYTVEMAGLYGIWVALLLGWCASAHGAYVCAEDLSEGVGRSKPE
jgi:hypothetical protein